MKCRKKDELKNEVIPRLAACGKKDNTNSKREEEKKIK